MCRLLESIRYENGSFDLMPFHRQRMQRARQQLFGITGGMELENILRQAAREQPERTTGLYKCRVVYDRVVREIRFLPYTFPQIRSLQLVEDNNIDYTLKYEDRSALNRLFLQRGTADDVLIVKKGLVTDTSFCNVLFFNGTSWLTPERPLLAGTRRAALLAGERVRTAVIRPSDLHYFSKVRLVNAMVRFEDKLDIPVKKIRGWR